MNEWSRLKLVTPASDPAVEVSDLKTMLGITGSAQDTALGATLDAAIAMIEGPYGIGVCLTEQVWQLTLDRLPREIVIPLGPVQSVDSISYRDGNGDTQTVSTWLEDLESSPVRIRAARGTSWPEHLCEIGSVKVQFTAGFEEVPAPLKHAILLLAKSMWRTGATDSTLLRKETVEGIGTFDYANPDVAQQVFDTTVERLIAPYRVGLYQ